MWRVAGALALLLVSVLAASADELVRSDLPLWSNGGDGVWPESFASDTGVGHRTIFMTGDWRVTRRDCKEAEQSDACQSWLRLSIASVFHGGFIIETAPSRPALNSSSDGHVGIIAELHARRRGARLYALQLGFQGGSTYWLLSAPADSPIRKLSRLDVRCGDGLDRARWREAKPRGYYLTGYCVVADRRALRLMAEAALNRPPLASWEWIGSDESKGQR
jgi:hypothetical protein